MIRPIVRALGLLAAVLAVLAVVFPLYFALAASLRPDAELFAEPTLIPRGFVLDHYRALFAGRELWRPIRSSLIVAFSTTALCVLVGTPCAYAIARLRFRGRSAIVGAILAASMFPQISIVSPLYLLLRTLGLIDTYPGLVLPYLTFSMPLTVWLLVGSMRELPASLEEAAMVDGASRFRALLFVIAPLMLPGIATAALLTFIFAYNEFLFALSFTLGPERQTVPVFVALLRGRYQVPWGQVMAAVIVGTLPVMAAVLAFQRRIVRTFAAGSTR
jgi:ABC-type glycerol-3-phosphate transport system permease component